MDPATALALEQLMSMAAKTVLQYSNGTITAEQATAMLTAASGSLSVAIDAFNAAGAAEG